MKVLKFVILGLIAAFAIISCDDIVGLGSKLDIEGPVVNFTSPSPSDSVFNEFVLAGTVSDNGGISQLLIKVEKDKIPFPRQWRNTNGNWEVSDDYGSSWAPLQSVTINSVPTEATWVGSNSVTWSIPVDMKIGLPPDNDPEEGQYMFIAQAWDKADMSDDNSFKTLTLIIDNTPPKVIVNKPLLYSPGLYNSSSGYATPTTDEGNEFEKLREMDNWKSPEYISKFQTGKFELQWGIVEDFTIKWFDLRFYKINEDINEDGDKGFDDAPSNNYIYRYYQEASPSNYLKPNGKVMVPSLQTTSNGSDGEVKLTLPNTRTVIKVVVVCCDMADNLQKDTLGYLVYWPQADIPWINFSGDIKPPTSYTGDFSTSVQSAYMVYPGVKIKAIAFHAQGIESVNYEVKKLVEPLKSTYSDCAQEPSDLPAINDLPGNEINPREVNNPSKRGKFDFEFVPEPRSAIYVVTATALSTSGQTSDPVTGVFKVQDITFPNFPTPIEPPAMKPLFQAVNNTDKSITISGIVDDATAIDNLCLVWINPASRSFSAMAQLDYFKDPDYPGWKQILERRPTAGTGYLEEYSESKYPQPSATPPYGYPYDSNNPNKLWNVKIDKHPDDTNHKNGINQSTKRVEYKFSQKILLSELNIGIADLDKNQPLKSQVFLLRAANPNPRVTIITYTPQGDEAPPVINISGVTITRNDGKTEALTPGQFYEIPKFVSGNTIKITGTWTEDSVEYLAFNSNLRDNFIIKVADVAIPVSNITFTGNTAGSKTGTWTTTARVGTTQSGQTTIPLVNLKDTLYISANLTDIGGNKSDSQASWLVQSDTLRLVRISSENADQSYGIGEKIKIFLEFNKPVLLKNGGNPALTLRVGNSNTVTAAYITNSTQSTRQYFEYTVANGQNTTDTYKWLDVIGLNDLAVDNYWESSIYPFTWVATGTTTEEIRVTMNSNHTAANNSVYDTAFLRRLPVATNSEDLMYTLASGKNISIDTTAPTVTRIYTNNKAGHYAYNAEIDINVEFSEPVKIADETNLPVLNLRVANATNTLVTTNNSAGSVKVNNKIVTFSYKVVDGDTTGDDKVIVDSFLSTAGSITDIAGNTMSTSLTDVNTTLNGGTANTGTGVYINTVKPSMPTFRALTGNNINSVISNKVNGSDVKGESGNTGSNRELKNYYGDKLWFAIIGNRTGGNNRVGYFEYSLDTNLSTTPTSWKRIDDETPFEQNIFGKYTIRVRQIDKAGNVSPISGAVTLNWDPGDFVERIDSSTPNGTYTNSGTPPSGRQDSINITVYFRKPITVTDQSTITLNASGSTFVTVNNTTGITNAKTLSFTYNVGASDNTPGGTGRTPYLDVTALSITAKDAEGVDVSSYVSKIPTDDDNKLGYRKDILVQTGALALATPAAGQTNPTYNITQSGDTATGTITVTFNRPVSKKAGTITIEQSATGYRLPAVLTEAQAVRYKNITNFNKYYSKGTNGFLGDTDGVDTSTKYILNYAETTRVDPANSSGINKLAYDFIEKERVSLLISSQDITVNGSTMTITLTSSNALQVLGASYTLTIPAGIVQDGLSYQSPLVTGTLTTPGINRPFVRVDKKVNQDSIATNTGGANAPYYQADFSNIIQTRARLDCRTPDSSVRYSAGGSEHTATGADSEMTDANRTGSKWRNNNNGADTLTYGTAQTVGATSGGYTYSTFNGTTEGVAGTDNITHITVGNNAESGYIWRIAVRSSKTLVNGNYQSNSDQYQEIAFRTVLTYYLNDLGTSYGQNMGNGDQLWLRGGDAVSSSSVPGFPLTWQDDYDKLKADNARAGVRLLRMVAKGGTGNMNNTSTWRWITWEINVRTYHDILLARGNAASVEELTQYGPRQWAYSRGGWVPLKDDYTLYPGKHRWLTMTNYGYSPGGGLSFTSNFNYRIMPDVTYPPSP